MLSGRGRSPSGGQLLPPGTVAPPLSYPARPRGPRAHLEVDRVHSQNVGVQLAQLGQGAGDVVNVPDRVTHGRHHLGAVRAQMRRAAVQVEVWKVGLGLGVAGEEPAGCGGNRTLVRPIRPLPWVQNLSGPGKSSSQNKSYFNATF